MPKILLPIDVANPHEELVDQLDKLIGLQSSEVRLLYVKEELPSLEHMLGTMANFPDDLSNQLTKKAETSICPDQISSVDAGNCRCQ